MSKSCARSVSADRAVKPVVKRKTSEQLTPVERKYKKSEPTQSDAIPTHFAVVMNSIPLLNIDEVEKTMKRQSDALDDILRDLEKENNQFMESLIADGIELEDDNVRELIENYKKMYGLN
ncbi:hypothetical protein DdX_03663 [Ditylenchus destructor]|uniref:Uncharacterized protein n=1 Tax=Ditylenchus destructor TaxID=166010 RepID=A0AAD4R870_9BILA|nr:hypothetical protein DdX_03663 [Ditylenchus destructor]